MFNFEIQNLIAELAIIDMIRFSVKKAIPSKMVFLRNRRAHYYEVALEYGEGYIYELHEEKFDGKCLAEKIKEV